MEFSIDFLIVCWLNMRSAKVKHHTTDGIIKLNDKYSKVNETKKVIHVILGEFF